MNLIVKIYRDREQHILSGLSQFQEFTDQQKIENFEYFILEFGTYTCSNCILV